MKNSILKRCVNTVLILFFVLIWSHICIAADARRYCDKGTDYLREGKLNKAITTLTKAIVLRHNYSKAYNNRGLAYYRQNNNIQAEKDFLKAIQFNPNDKNAHNNVAIVFCRQGQYDQALMYLNQALAMMKEPQLSDADVYNNLGFVYVKKGMYKKAMEAYGHAGHIIQNSDTDISDAYDKITLDQRIDGHPMTAKFYGE